MSTKEHDDIVTEAKKRLEWLDARPMPYQRPREFIDVVADYKARLELFDRWRAIQEMLYHR